LMLLLLTMVDREGGDEEDGTEERKKDGRE
jgi:hypothetical protein